MTLRVKLEIVPFGDEARAYEIGRLDIFNIGPGVQPGLHVYGVIDMPQNGKAGLYKDTVQHHRPDGAWELVRKVIATLGIKGP